MENNNDVFNRMKRPTMQQVRYLENLSRLPKKRGAVMVIAEKYGVNHGTVSRFFKACFEAGYIDKEYELTEKGRAWLSFYVNMEKELETYLDGIGVPKNYIDQNVQSMEENVSAHVLKAMVSQAQPVENEINRWHKRIVQSISIENMIEKGEYPVSFVVLKHLATERGNYGVEELSMADQGFVKPALLKHDDTGISLELTLCDMQANSRISGHKMSGRLASLSYISDGVLKKAPIEDGKVCIPLEGGNYYIRTETRLTGLIPVTVTCSVGRAHMPESTALLVLWL